VGDGDVGDESVGHMTPSRAPAVSTSWITAETLKFWQMSQYPPLVGSVKQYLTTHTHMDGCEYPLAQTF